MLGFEPYHHKARNDGQGSSRGQPVWTSGASFYERRHGHVASQPRGNPCGGRQVAITARSVFMTGASRLSCPLRASPRLWANRVDAKIGTVRSRACGPSGSLPQLPGGSPGAALVDVRTKLRQVADEVDGETVTRASAADLDDCQAGCSDQSGDPEQRYPDLDPVTAAALLCWMPELGSLDRRQAAALIGVAPMATVLGISEAGAGGRVISCSWPRPRQHASTRIWCATRPTKSPLSP